MNFIMDLKTRIKENSKTAKIKLPQETLKDFTLL